ncbi:MAG: gliding motility-associated protein GldE [Bacteroidales bacterium]|nr:gliding motility-associated protein GldE [Bacteroidales bacterium]
MDPDPYNQAASFGVNTIIGIVVLVLLLICSGLISASETAFFGLTANHKDKLKKSNSPKDKLIMKLLGNPEKLLATILVVNNFVNIAIVIITNFLTVGLVSSIHSQILLILVQTIGITFVILLFGEMIPKIIASKYQMGVSRLMSYPMMVLEPLCSPFTIILVKSTNAVKKRLQKNHSAEISIEDLSQAIELTSADLKDDREMLEDIVNSSSLDVREIMTSRVDVFAIEYDAKFSKVIGDIVESGFSRIPIYEDNLDNIVGILYIKDVLAHIDNPDFDWHTLIRPHFIVPETKMINTLLADFQSKKMHIAIVIDEYGGVSGIVTLEDILEEFVGEINDEFDTDEDTYKKHDDNTYEFDAKTSIVDFCKIVDVDYEIFQDTKGESETLAGMLLEVNQEIPPKGKATVVKGFEFVVTASNERRIKKIKVKLPENVKNE